MKITVFCEKVDNPEAVKIYPEGFGKAIADVFGEDVTLVTQNWGEDGSKLLDVLEDTDVLVWWAHCMHASVSDEVSAAVCDRVRRGMGFIALHSAHLCKPLKGLLGTTCTLKWRESGDNERLWVVAPGHPIVEGIGEYADVEKEEMYGEYFDIPTPDELVLIGWFKGGEVFRGGCVFNRGYGKIFYFNPGHETYPTYRNEKVKRIMRNAAEYVCPKKIHEPFTCPNPPSLEGNNG